jgi:Flp pilus assembly protein protease CpaA
MDLIILKQIIVLVASFLSAYTDHKTGLIPDKITYPLIGAGILFAVIETNFFAIATGAGVFAIGYLVYWLGKIGGGDVKLFTGMAIVFPLFAEQLFILNVILMASITAVLFYSAYYSIKYAQKGINWKQNRKGLLKAGVLGIIFAIYFTILLKTGFVTQTTIVLLSTPVFLGLVFYALESGIRKEFFLKQVNVNELEEDEILATEFLEEKTKNALTVGFKGVIGEKEKNNLIQNGIGTVPVYRNLPRFGPFIFLGTIITFYILPLTEFGGLF